MPYGVSQWPYSPDPRPPDFCIAGFDFGKVPPWRWQLRTKKALSPYDVFNGDGVTVEATSHAVDTAEWENVLSLPGGVTCLVRITGTQEPQGGPPFTILLYIELNDGIGPKTSGVASYTYPDAISVLTVPLLGFDTGPDSRTPEPFTIKPRKWNV